MIVFKLAARALMVLLPMLLLPLLLGMGCKKKDEASVVNEKTTKPSYDGTIIAMGDSLTAGYGVAPDSSYPAQLQKKLRAADFNWRVVNAGISGETSSGALARIKWILAQHPDIVILETGANDALRGIPISLIRENIDKAVELLQKGGATVVLAGMRITPNLGPEYTASFADIYPAVAQERQAILVPFFLTGVAGDPTLNQEDGIHPTAKGYKIIGETIFPYALQAIDATR